WKTARHSRPPFRLSPSPVMRPRAVPEASPSPGSSAAGSWHEMSNSSVRRRSGRRHQYRFWPSPQNGDSSRQDGGGWSVRSRSPRSSLQDPQEMTEERATARSARRTDVWQAKRGAYITSDWENLWTSQALVSNESPELNRTTSVRESEVREQRRSESVQEAVSTERSCVHGVQQFDNTERM
ncbi:Hypothetical predicted protein, partial [Pelobates cultripes]